FGKKIRQMKGDYERIRILLPPTPYLPSPGLRGAIPKSFPPSVLQLAPTSGFRRGENPAPDLEPAAVQPTSSLQSAAAVQPTSGLQNAAIVQPKSASTSSIRHRGRRKRDTSAQVIGGPGDASAPAQATEGLGDASAPALATEGLADASAPAQVSEGLGDASASAPGLKAFQGFSKRLVLVLVPEPCYEGFKDEKLPEPVPEQFKKELVLVLASEPIDEGFEEEAPPDPVSEGFEEQLVLILTSEGPPGSASASEGLPGSASASEGSPGSASASESSPGTEKAKPDSTPDSKPPEFHQVSGGSFTLLGRPPDHQFLRHWPPRSLCLCRPPSLRRRRHFNVV
ncbi:hypothetical protein CRENBAI_018406, partial [Crenichthys baileyi]